MLSTLITVMAIAPLIGPFAGAQMLRVAGWRAIFWVLVAVGAITLLSLATIPETLPKERRSLMPLGMAFRGYARLLSRPKLMAYAAAGAFFYAGAFTYIAGTPFAFITYYGVSEIAYSLLFALSVGAVMLTNTLNARLVARLGVDRLLLVGSLILAVAGLVLAFDALTGFGGLLGLVLPLFVYMGLNGLIVANSIAGSLTDYPRQAGAVSALVGALQYGAGIAGSALLGLFADGTPWPIGWIIVRPVLAAPCAPFCW